MAPMVQVLRPTDRVMRRPQHQFQLRQRPWQVQPFLLAPVLPGETLENLLVQARIITDPIKNPLVGWWAELYFFYVKHRDLAGRDDFSAMMLDPSTSLAAYHEASVVHDYHAGPNRINWTSLCKARVVEEYFRDADEAVSAGVIGSTYSASINQQSWLDSVMNDDDYLAPDVDITVGVDDIVTTSELETAFRQWELLRMQNLTEQTYEEYLTTYGVKMPQVELHKPELIRYVRDWKYPTNTVDPTDGSAASAVVWSIAERADKRRFFTEPGFICGYSVVRPKVYRSAQKGSAADLMDNVYTWLPAVLHGDVEHSIVKQTAGTGPLQGTTDDYRVDVRDILLYGDQFVNFATTEADANFVALPTAALGKRYASNTDADALFSAASPANQIRSDGVVSLQIRSMQRDLTPRTNV